MVVNGGRGISFVNSYSSTNFDMISCGPPQLATAGKAVLICQQNSHPFLDRTLNLEQSVKIGRSVARARAAQNNGIFDCKVLSRNHALFWYTNGKFFLQDTKSSNGTFVNNQRLSKSGEESLPREVCSGDIVQFGVDVLENSRKVTHGCIVANLKLYLPDGKEAKASSSTAVLSCVGSIPVEDLYQLNQHIQEALQREQMLQTKLASLQDLVLSLQQASDLSWKALIAEDRLLSRVETLETQLQTYSKNFAEDKLREELRKLNEDKNAYQSTAKECLKKILEEKLEAIQKFEDIKITLMNTEAECANFKELMEQSHGELKELALKHSAQIVKTEELQEKLQVTEDQMKEIISRLESDNEDLNSEVQKLLCNEAILQEKITKLYSSEGEVQEYKLDLDSKPKTCLESFTAIFDSPPNDEKDKDLYMDESDPYLEDENYLTSKMDVLHIRLGRTIQEYKKQTENVDLLTAQVCILQEDKCAQLKRINAMEYELEVHAIQLKSYREQNKSLEERLVLLEQRLEVENMNSTMNCAIIEETSPLKEEISNISNGFNTAGIENLQAQISELKELLTEAREKSEVSEETVKILQQDLDSAKNNLSEITENLSCTTEKLQDAQNMKDQRETSLEEIKQRCKAFQCLFTEKAIKFKELISLLQEDDNKKEEETLLLKKQLLEPQQNTRQNKNELEQLKEDLKVTTEELEVKLSDETSNNWDNRTLEDYEAVKQECASLKRTINTLESQLLTLQEMKLEAEKLDGRLKDQPDSVAPPSTLESHEDTESFNLKIQELEEEVVMVKEHFSSCNEERTRLEKELALLRQDYQGVTRQSSFYNCVFLLPLLILFVAVTIAFYPTLSYLFGTSDRA